ncbi:MAG: hypothetical protein AAGA93_03145 [Actinomycetota bacterium]
MPDPPLARRRTGSDRSHRRPVGWLLLGVALALLLGVGTRPVGAQSVEEPSATTATTTAEPAADSSTTTIAAQTATTTAEPAVDGSTTAATADPVPSGASADRVPCEVAMVVGCVTTVQGADGPVPLTLRVAGESGTADGGDESRGTIGSVAVGATADAGAAAAGDDGPVRSGVDPWERGGLRSNFGTASIPISHYQIGADVTGFMGVPDPLDSFVASQTNWAFTTSTFLVLLATNTLDWAFEFPLANDLIGRAGILAQDYTIEFFGFGLSTSIYALALSVTMVVAGFKAVTKGIVAAGSEVGMAFVAYVILIVLTLSSGFGDAGLHVARLSTDLSGSIAAFASGEDRQAECAAAVSTGDTPLAGATASTSADAEPPAARSTACSFGFAMQRSLVELPYQNLQWGQVLDGVAGKEQCAAINRELLAEGPWGNSDEPRERMGAVTECEENAQFNGQATYIRLGIASANALAAAIVTLLVLVVAAMLLWQQLKLLFLTAILPHTLVFAILPGRSRALAWRWLEQLVGVVIRTVILALGLVVWLSLFSLIVYEQLTFRGIFLSLFASTAMAVAGFYGLIKLGGITNRVNPAGRLGGGSGSGGDPGGGGDSGGDDRRRADGGRTVTTVAAASAMRSVRTRSSTPVGAGRP